MFRRNLMHRNSFSADADDAVGAVNGQLVGSGGTKHWWNFCRHAMAGLILVVASLPLATQAGGGFFPKGTNVTSLVVIADGNLANPAQKTMIATLQGIVARQSAKQIY